MLVCGASGSGKTVFTNRLLSHRAMLRNVPQRVVWCYGVWQEGLRDSPYELHQGVPSEELLREGNMVLVIDDLMQEAKSNTTISDIFTKYSHHNNITCICLMQNLFPKGTQMRNISLNSNYIVLMKNSRDRAQIRHLAAQMYPSKSQFLVKSYEDATKDAFGYLLLDFRNVTPEKIRVRTGILPGEVMYAYVG